MMIMAAAVCADRSFLMVVVRLFMVLILFIILVISPYYHKLNLINAAAAESYNQLFTSKYLTNMKLVQEFNKINGIPIYHP